MKVLLVEDDAMLGEVTRQGLKQEGYATDLVANIEYAESALLTQNYDVVILDLGLPDGNGINILKKLRKKEDKTPVIILTAQNTIKDRVKGLDAGADDYLAKPFDIEELCARTRALHRRNIENPSPIISYKDIILDPTSYQVIKNNKNITLGPKEFVILQTLIEKAGKIISKEVLQEKLYSFDDDISSNTVEVHVHRLRKKLGNDIIKNIRGVGYIAPQ